MKHVVTAAPSRQCVLVTGFGAFPGARTNPTAAILRDLERQTARLARLGIALRCEMMPVVYAEIEDALHHAVAAHRPDAVLHLGLAARRARICVETRAINRAGPLHLDAARRLPPAQILARGAPSSLRASYPAAPILAALQRAGLPARRSRDAGDYVCNATLYRSLLDPAAPQVGFLHVPRPASQVRRASAGGATAGRPRPTAAALSRAALIAILVMARHRGASVAASTGCSPPGPRHQRRSAATISTSAAPAPAAM